jgi:spermidine/putrescine transport system ATP-binding protein
VMSQGNIEQVGTPEELYERPRTRFVADFLAVRNLLEASVGARTLGRVSLSTRGGLVLAAEDDGGYREGAPVWVGIRPERMNLEGGGENALPGTLDDEIYLGDRTDWRVRVGDEILTVAEGAAAARGRRRGDAVTVSFPAEAVLRLEDAP